MREEGGASARDAVVDALTAAPRPAYARRHLEKLAGVLKIELNDLLEPRRFAANTHVWLATHNRLVADQGSPEDEAMAREARNVAAKLVPRIFRNGHRPTPLVALVG